MKRLGYALVALYVLNAIVFVAITRELGGSALNGKVEGGKFFVGDHGRYAEVSASTYEFSRWHTYAFLATNPALLIALFALERRRKNR